MGVIRNINFGLYFNGIKSQPADDKSSLAPCWRRLCPDFYCYFWAYPFLLFSFSVLHFLVVVSMQ